MLSTLNLAFRQLTKSPGFTAVAMLTLALGIGMSTAAFSIANTFLLRGPPYPELHRIVRIYRTAPHSQTLRHAPANFRDIREGATSFTALAAYNYDGASLAEPGQPAKQISGLSVTPAFFQVMGVQPKLGRAFSADEDQPGKGLVVILTHRMWVRRFNSDPDVINRTLRLNAEQCTIIGVMPAEFDAPLVWGQCDYLRPLTFWPSYATERSNAWFSCVGRLKPGITPELAQQELTTLASRLATEHPKELATDGLKLVDFHRSNMDDMSRSIIWLMVGLSAAVLFIACANLASLQVARAFGRARDYAICSALGGNRGQLMIPLLTESLLLSAGGGIAGLLVGMWTNDLLGRSFHINGEVGFNLPLDHTVLAFAVICSAVSGLAFGLAPAWLAARSPAADALKEGSRGTTSGRTHQRLKNGLIIGQLALALVLIGIAGSFAVGVKAFTRRNTGWQTDGIFAGSVGLPHNRYPDDASCLTFQKNLLERLRALPGVTQAVLTTGLPVYSYSGSRSITVEGRPAVERGREPLVQLIDVSSDYFAALRIPLKQGAFFDPQLRAEDPPVALINESAARQLWPNENPVGRRLQQVDKKQWLQIVGVVGDVDMAVNFGSPETRLHLYRPIMQVPSHYFTVVLHTTVAPESITASVQRTVAALDPDIPVDQADTVQHQIDESMANINIVIVNLGTFAVMGLLISALGLYGVISQLTAQRTRDIGVRIALGAQANNILNMILGQGARLLAIGLVAGIPLLLVLNQVVHRVLPEMPIPGLWLLLVTVILLSATALFACWLPARRATRINPVDALRAE